MISSYLRLEMLECVVNSSILLTFFNTNSPTFQGRGMNCFFLRLQQMEPIAVLPCYFCNKHFVCNVTWKESRFFRGAKNSYDSVIIQMFECPLPVQKNGCLFIYVGGYSPNNKTLKTNTKPLKTS